MSTFKLEEFSATNYENFRPLYPPAFYEFLRQYIGKSSVDLAVDMACGTGQATRQLATFCDRVVGVDPSEIMLEVARFQLADDPNIEFATGKDADLGTIVEPDSVDLLTVAEAAHWLAYPDFWERAHAILKPGGTLAIWAYYLFDLVGHPTVAGLFEHFIHEECGAYWDPGQLSLRNYYADLAMPPQLFDSIDRSVNLSDQLRPDHPLELVRSNIPLRSIRELLSTLSGYHNWHIANPTEPDILDILMAKIRKHTSLEDESLVTVKWSTVYMVGKAKKTTVPSIQAN